MANIICRPELHGATTREQYSEFHAGMEEIGFLRTITRNGTVYRLPDAEYLAVNITTPMNLLDLKITALAIRITGRPCKLTLTPVVDISQIYISGLEKEVSFASALVALGIPFASSYPGPNYSALSGLAAAMAEGKNTVPSSPQSSYPEPNYSALAALAAAMSKA